MNEKIAIEMDSHEIQERAAKVLLATDPSEYLAEAIDRLAESDDQPDDIQIAVELLADFETDLQLVAHDSSLLLHTDIEAILNYGQNSEIGLRIIYSLFKEVGFAEDTMLAAIEMNEASTRARVNNLRNLKILRDVYAT